MFVKNENDGWGSRDIGVLRWVEDVTQEFDTEFKGWKCPSCERDMYWVNGKKGA